MYPEVVGRNDEEGNEAQVGQGGAGVRFHDSVIPKVFEAGGIYILSSMLLHGYSYFIRCMTYITMIHRTTATVSA